ncbi:hypothetical protein [Cryptosporangium sp. NPDC048952]|uniref:hypothetical protein n=1 Tax=Cryptosporangium sp. NPDC048952 TaxID=3363961 RepID=UPI0037132FE4
MMRLVVALAFLLLVPSSAAASPPLPGVPPWVGAEPVVQARELYVGAGGSLFVGQIRWTSLTPERGTAVGVVHVNECTPTCAAGTLRQFPAALEFDDVTDSSFTCLRLTYAGRTTVVPLGSRRC